MTQRDNLIKLLKREGFDFAPVQFGLCPHLVNVYREQTKSGLPYPDYFEFPWRGIPHPAPDRSEEPDWLTYYTEELAPGTRFSEFGVAHEPRSEAAMHMTRMHHPMKNFDSLEQFQAYPYPRYDHADLEKLKGEIAGIQAAGNAAMASMGMTIWEVGWYMRSMEELMMDMMTDSPLAEYHLDRLTEQACQKAAAFAAAGADLIHFGDDIGMQSSIMMSEDLYRTWIKPRLAKVVKAARQANPETIITYHSCGYVVPFIPDLIEVGIQVLNPVQPESMSFSELHDQYGDKLSFWGTLGTQTLFPFGTPAEVRARTLENLEIAGNKGGLLCAPTHLVEPEVPWENIMAYVQACRDFAPA